MVRSKLSSDDLQPDLDMMMNPDKWPCWPRLPLKRRRTSGPSELACMISGLEDKPAPIVWFAMLHERISADTKHKVYPDLAAIIMDGWRVD